MREMAARFIQVACTIVVALCAGVCVWVGFQDGWPKDQSTFVAQICTLVCLCEALAAMVVVRVPKLNAIFPRLIAVGGGLIGVAGALAWSTVELPLTESISLNVMRTLGVALGSFIMGSVTVAWLLGHAYLTATKMTIAPLRVLSRLFSLAVFLRFAYLLVACGVIYLGPAQEVGPSDWSRLMGSWLVLSMRVGVGILTVAVLAYMVGDCVKLRSTQSATGILYFASVFVYIGELSSQNLAGEVGLPL